ncbi:MAG: DUF935 family protein [Candidatus Competibacter sp.]|nr:DUF935 family protein [Candidatus Competibacter sp.]MDG4583388.1 DUF935 family protein [Candidatus Competibacter sp.]
MNPADFAAPAAPVRQEIASTADGRDITRFYVRPDLRLSPQDTILNTATYRNLAGYDLFQDLLTDWTVFSTLQQRRLAMVSAETEVVPGGKRQADKSAAAFIEQVLKHIGWDRVSAKMHFGIYYGLGVAECLWATDGAQVIPDAIKARDRRRFCYDGAMRLRLLTAADAQPGELLPERKFWAFQTGADHDDEPYGVGLAHWLYWPVTFKRSGVKFWLVAAEKFGSPTAVGFFPPELTEADQQKLLVTLGKIRTDAGLIAPDGTRIDLLEAKRAAGGDYGELCRYMDQAIHRVVLSQLAATDSTASKLNVSNDDPATWQRLIKADADLICESFNDTVVRWLCDWNFPGAAYPQVWRRTEPGADLAQRSEIEERIYKVGYRPTLAQIQGEYDGEWEPVPAPVPALPAIPLAEPAPLAFAASPPPFEKGGAGGIHDRLGREAAPLIDGLLEPVRSLLKRGADFDELRDGLLKLYPDLDATAFAELLGRAFAVADAAGRFAVMDSTKEGDES